MSEKKGQSLFDVVGGIFAIALGVILLPVPIFGIPFIFFGIYLLAKNSRPAS